LDRHSGNTVRREQVERSQEKVKGADIIGAVRVRIEQLSQQEKLKEMGQKIYAEFKDVFEDLPHVDKLSNEIHCEIKLKDTQKTISTRSYTCPQKYREAWQVLIKQHLDTVWRSKGFPCSLAK
jgi:hypothetical protein